VQLQGEHGKHAVALGQVEGELEGVSGGEPVAEASVAMASANG
jgi:hypothetical protein